MGIQNRNQLLEDGEAPRQIAERRIGGVTGIVIGLAPIVAGIIILCNRIAGGFQFLHINGGAMLCKLGVVKAGREEGVNLGHGAVIAQWTGPGKQPEEIVFRMGRML